MFKKASVLNSRALSGKDVKVLRANVQAAMPTIGENQALNRP